MLTVLVLCLAALVIRTSVIELRYYQAIKHHEPRIWFALGAPAWFKAPFILFNVENHPLFSQITHPQVLAYSKQHRRAGLQFIVALASTLVVLILYFKLA
ncbi:hypothetical protein TUM4644_26800 [Shewanella colwelliana]|uniref:hypothetical protein n=1 Tax=Shewanella colwelliana TaxID=23 RepID=UPI001BC7F075|nr:hypothetical protein [Shewanella colwelliana]GIU28847.1 hypothetical protein TUM4644_26800 [Shewanella colwelliana]